MTEQTVMLKAFRHLDNLLSEITKGTNEFFWYNSIRSVFLRKVPDSGAIRHRIRSFPIESSGGIESPGFLGLFK
jgi:hypothetical protein